MTQASPLLRVRDLVVRHRADRRSAPTLTAVRGVSLEVDAGEIHALVGESGSGKTSLARAVLGLLPIAQGQVLLHGEDLAALSPAALRARRRQLQAVFQDPLAALSPRRTVAQTLVEPLRHFGIGNPGEWQDRSRALLQLVGLDTDLDRRYPHELSGGQRQRVCLARALAAEPELVVADEPVSSLDLATRQRILALIRDLCDRLGVAFLLVSHDLSDVRQVADRVSVLYGGTLVESGPTARVFSQPAHPYSRCLLAAIPRADPAAPRPRPLAGEPPSALTPPAGCVFHKRCPEAIAECSRIEPPLRPVPSGSCSHTARCHLCQD